MKKFLIPIILILITTTFLPAQDMKWRWSNSAFNVTPEANLTHLIGSAFLADYFESRGLVWWQADLAAFGMGLAWEIKDGFVPYESVPVFGAEGFSKMDIAVDLAGVLLNRAINITLEKAFKMDRKDRREPRDPGDYYY
ncbi:MAG: hypothetical protein JXQ65_03550 [Candidatus Marinimicrobia bacterium]|nr:hypothetical protein [Candidatus Neomarinimicrobiota bacterium]